MPIFLNGSLQTVHSRGCFWNSESLRLEICDPLNQKISLAAKRLARGSENEPLGFWKALFWKKISFINAEGQLGQVLVNKSSWNKRLKAYGVDEHILNLSPEASNVSFLLMNQFASQIAHQKVAQLSRVYSSKNKKLIKTLVQEGVKKFLLNPSILVGSQEAAKLSLDCGQTGLYSVSLISQFNADSHKWTISFLIEPTLKECKLFDMSLSQIQEVSCYLHNRLKQSSLAKIYQVLDDETMRIERSELDQIVDYLSRPEFNFLFDRSRSSGSQYPLELKKSQTGLSRSIVILSPLEILLISSSKKHDRLVGTGTFKKIKKAYNLAKGQWMACYAKTETKKAQTTLTAFDLYTSRMEVELKKRLAGVEGVVSLKAEAPSRIIEELYDTDLFHLADHINFSQRLGLLKSIFTGLHNLHRLGLIHRDIKPENILLKQNPDGTIRAAISDLGLSCFKGSLDAERLAGTDGFIPPEIPDVAPGEIISASKKARLKAHTTESFDIYSLGVTLKELFSNYIPETPLARAMQPVKAEDEPKKTLLVELITLMTQSDPDDRASWPQIFDYLDRINRA